MTHNTSSVWSNSTTAASDAFKKTDTRNDASQLQSNVWKNPSSDNISSLWANASRIDTSHRTETDPFPVALRTRGSTPERDRSQDSSPSLPLTGSFPIEEDNNSDILGGALSAGSPASREPLPTMNDHSPVEQVIIGRLMTSSEIVAILTDHGCPDVTNLLDMSTSSMWPISTGGFGDVYRVKLYDSTEVAIKTTRIDVGSNEGGKHLKHAARELHTWAQCNHTNVVKLLGLAIFRDQIGMVSLWMRNGSLPSYLSQTPNVNRYRISRQISQGLVYLHANGIVHGDLKGFEMNVLVSDDGTPALTDFGNSVLTDVSLGFTATTSKASISLRWTAPELLESEASSPYTKEADVYALGMTILEAMTGTVPYAGKSEQSVMFCVWQRKLPVRPEIICRGRRQDDILWSLLEACWLNDPRQRPTAVEVVETLNTASDDALP